MLPASFHSFSPILPLFIASSFICFFIVLSLRPFHLLYNMEKIPVKIGQVISEFLIGPENENNYLVVYRAQIKQG